MKTALMVMAALGAASGCDFPPDLWCGSDEIATKCKVSEQCRNYLTEKDAAPPVSVELYYEYLCSGCQDFIVHQLYRALLKVPTILNITLVPYGNSKEEKVGDRWKFTCQFGEDMCTMNTYMCAEKAGVPADPILDCGKGNLGNQLQHQMALKTDALRPSHQYVPWIVLNGVHTKKINDQAQGNLLRLVCRTYTGLKPAGCPGAEPKPSVCVQGDLN